MTAAPPPVTAPDARRRAKEALAAYDAWCLRGDDDQEWGDLSDETVRIVCAVPAALRALLAEPAPAALDEGVADAAERLAHTLTPPINSTDDGFVMVSIADARALLSALGAKR